MRKNKGIEDSHRLEILEEYLQSSSGKRTIEKIYGLSSGTIRNWLRIFALEDKVQGADMVKQEAELQEVTCREREEMLSLKLQVKQLETSLRQAEMARDAYECMIKLAEEKYHIPIRKNSAAK